MHFSNLVPTWIDLFKINDDDDEVPTVELHIYDIQESYRCIKSLKLIKQYKNTNVQIKTKSLNYIPI